MRTATETLLLPMLRAQRSGSFPFFASQRLTMLFICAQYSSGVAGFALKTSAPSAWLAATADGSRVAVRTTTGIVLVRGLLRSCSRTCSPASTEFPRFRSMRSGPDSARRTKRSAFVASRNRTICAEGAARRMPSRVRSAVASASSMTSTSTFLRARRRSCDRLRLMRHIISKLRECRLRVALSCFLVTSWLRHRQNAALHLVSSVAGRI